MVICVFINKRKTQVHSFQSLCSVLSLRVIVVEVYLDVVGLHNPRGQWTEVRCTMTLGTEVVSRDQCGRSVLDVCRETRQLHTMFLHPGPHLSLIHI